MEHVPREGGLVLAANHSSNFDPWPLGIPLFPRRFLRFMGKSELFWFPLGAVHPSRRRVSGAAGPARPGGDRRPRCACAARGTSSSCSPRARGARRDCARSTRPAGGRAPRASRSRPVCRSFPRRSRYRPAGAVRPAPGRLRACDRDRRPGRARAGRGRARLRPSVCARRSRSSSSRCGEPAPRRRRRRLRPPRLPRPAAVGAARRRGAGQRDHRFHVDAAAPVGGGAIRAPSSSAGTRSTSRRTATSLLPGYQGGRVFDPEIVEQLELLPALVASTGIVCAKAAGYEADDFLAAAADRRGGRGGTALVATSDRDAFQLVSRRRHGAAARARRQRDGPDRPGRGARALRRRARAGDGLHRAARRPVGQDPRRARRRGEDRGNAAAGARDARRPARRGAVRGGGRTAPRLPVDRDDGS